MKLGSLPSFEVRELLDQRLSRCGEGVPDVGGVAVLGAPTGGVADPYVAAA